MYEQPSAALRDRNLISCEALAEVAQSGLLKISLATELSELHFRVERGRASGKATISLITATS